MGNIKVDFRDLEKFAKELEKARDTEIRKLIEQTTNEIALRLMQKVVKRTPVGVYENEIIETYKHGNKKKGIKAGDVKLDKKGKPKKKTYTTKTRKNEKGENEEYQHTGGTLRRGWNISAVKKTGDGYEVTVSNPVEYAAYVEYGHRQEPGKYISAIGKRLKKAWVEGKFMLTKSEIEIKGQMEKIISKKIEAWLKEVFK